MKWFLDLTMRGKLFAGFGVIFALIRSRRRLVASQHEFDGLIYQGDARIRCIVFTQTTY